MNIEKKNNRKPNSSRTHGISWSVLVLSLSICVMTLSGCASSPTIIAPDCPRPAPIPAHLSESDSPAVQSYSQKVQTYLSKVQAFLRESQESTTP